MLKLTKEQFVSLELVTNKAYALEKKDAQWFLAAHVDMWNEKIRFNIEEYDEALPVSNFLEHDYLHIRKCGMYGWRLNNDILNWTGEKNNIFSTHPTILDLAICDAENYYADAEYLYENEDEDRAMYKNAYDMLYFISMSGTHLQGVTKPTVILMTEEEWVSFNSDFKDGSYVIVINNWYEHKLKKEEEALSDTIDFLHNTVGDEKASLIAEHPEWVKELCEKLQAEADRDCVAEAQWDVAEKFVDEKLSENS